MGSPAHRPPRTSGALKRAAGASASSASSRAFSPARTIGTASWKPARPHGLRFSAPCGSTSRTSAGVPAFGGVAEYYSESPYDTLLRLDKPGPGIAALGAFNCGGPSMVALSFYLYGDQAPGTVARETPLWDAWFQKRFPMPTEPGKSE